MDGKKTKFGCTAYVLIQGEHCKKLDNHSVECIFLGYSKESKAYRLMKKGTRQIIISKDVILMKLITQTILLLVQNKQMKTKTH